MGSSSERISDTLSAFLARRDDDAIVVIDRHGRTAFVNDAALRLLGDDPLAWLDRVAPDPHPSRAQFVAAARENGGATVDVRLPTSDAGACLTEIRFDATRVGDDLVVCARNVAPEMATERELRHLRRIESAGLLTASVVHDLNNLLTPVLCLGSLLQEQVPANSLAASYAHEIDFAAQRAATLVRQLLTFVRRSSAPAGSFDVARCVSDMAGIVKQLAGAAVTVEYDIDESAERLVRADREQLEQVLLNLVANAADAMPRGGRLTIGVYERALEVAERGSMRSDPGVCIYVRDTGVGIAPEVRDRIFDRFFTTKGPQRGTGLGLATAHRFVVSHGGTVDVDSEPGRGTTVSIVLPREVRTDTRPVSDVVRVAPPGGRETILVVDDDERLRMAVRLVLESHGYRVFDASTGAKAIAYAIDEPLDLVVVDVGLARLNGATLVDAIRATGSDATVVFVSGHPDEVLAAHGVDPSTHRVLRKSFGSRALLERVREALDARRSALHEARR